MDNQLLQVKEINKVFTSGSFIKRKQFQAVKDVNFTLNYGEVLAIVGESGSGKSTLARMITHLITPSSGDILFEGKSIVNEKSLNKSLPKYIQMIFQDPFAALNPSHKIGHIIERALKIQKQANGLVREQVLELLTQVGLTPAEDFFDKFPNQLSGGQKQRVVIAKVLGLNPSIIVADEPTSMLDVSIGVEIMNLLLDLKNQNNLSYIFITHNLGSARYMADRIMVMLGGQVMEIGDVEEIIQDPKHPYTKLLLHSSPDPWRRETNDDEFMKVHDDTLSKEGCPFQKRCPLATEACNQGPIPVVSLSDRRQVRCTIYDQLDEVEGAV